MIYHHYRKIYYINITHIVIKPQLRLKIDHARYGGNK